MICNRFADSFEDLTLQVVSVLNIWHPPLHNVDISVLTPEELELLSEAALDCDDRHAGALTSICGEDDQDIGQKAEIIERQEVVEGVERRSMTSLHGTMAERVEVELRRDRDHLVSEKMHPSYPTIASSLSL